MVKIDDLEREMNDKEFAQYQKDIADEQARKEEAQAKADSKQSALAKLAALGLTENEVNGLIS